MFKNKITIIILVSFLTKTTYGQDESESVKALMNELFIKRDYDKYTFPVKDHNKAVNVSIWMANVRIYDLDIKSQILTINAYIRLNWFDEHLSWNPSDFGGQTLLALPSDIVWKPDLTVINSPDIFNFESAMKRSSFWLKSDGSIEWTPICQLRSYCMTDLTYYPNDVQNCVIIFESFFEYKYVDFKTYEQWNVTDYIQSSNIDENPQWKILNMQCTKYVHTYPGGTFPSLSCIFTLERRLSLLYYFINTPIFVAICLSLVMMSFPQNSIKRFKLSVVSLSILLLVLLFIANQIGFVGNKGIPLIVSKIAITIVFISVIIFSSIALNLLKSSGPLPQLLSVVIRNPLMKFIGVGDYMINLAVNEGTDSGIIITYPSKTLTESQSQWILLTLLLDKIILLIYILFLISVYS